MIWRIMHRLFGWDYVLYKPASTWLIRRVSSLPNGRRYVRCDFEHHFLDDINREVIVPLTFRWNDGNVERHSRKLRAVG